MENNLEEIANKIRINTVKEVYYAQSGHPGGSLSIADILAVLYFKEMKIDPKNPKWEERDRLVVSKGHCGPAVYAALAVKGFFPMEWMKTINQPETKLPSHCDKNRVPGIDMTTGSLGQGMSTALGIAWGLRYQKNDAYTYLFLGGIIILPLICEKDTILFKIGSSTSFLNIVLFNKSSLVGDMGYIQCKWIFALTFKGNISNVG